MPVRAVKGTVLSTEVWGIEGRERKKKKNRKGSKRYAEQAWWPIPLIPALQGQRQEDLCAFKASLVYTASFWASQGCTMRRNGRRQQTPQDGEKFRKRRTWSRPETGQRPDEALTCDDVFNGPISVTLIDEWFFQLLPF